MKKFVFLFFIAALTACNGYQGAQYVAGSKGDPGQPGPTGPGGSNGHSPAFGEAPADLTVCPAGGETVSIGLDLNDDGILEPAEVQQTFSICNGTSETDDSNGKGNPNKEKDNGNGKENSKGK